MSSAFEQAFAANSEALAEVRGCVREVCQRAGCSAECSEQAVLAINEACMNIVQHGYAFAAGKNFLLRIRVDDGILVTHLLDNGTAAADQDLRPRELDDLRPGGLGVRFMRELMDEVTYLPAPDGFTNCLQLRKRIY
jgi:sigma-B regulation protein RsbU (phosphoserine phosphatase)